MIFPEKITTFTILSLLIISAPGPTSFYVLSQGLCRGRRKVFAAVLGVVTANITWVVLCSAGIATIVRDSAEIFYTLKMIGSAYLVYVGISIWRSSNQTPERQAQTETRPFVGIFMKGFMTSMSNPKAALFYLSFLPQFVTTDSNYPVETLAWGMGYVLLVLSVMSVHGLSANRIYVCLGNRRGTVLFKRLLACCFLASAIALFEVKKA